MSRQVRQPGPVGGLGGVREWRVIAEVALTADGAISLTSIPGTFRHLQLVCYLRAAQAVVNVTTTLRFNNDSGANYDYVYNRGLNVTNSIANAIATTFMIVGATPGNSAAANVFGALDLLIPSYAQATNHKTLLGRGEGLDVAAANADLLVAGGKWRSTAAINRIDLLDGALANLWKAGSVATLLAI